LHLSDVIKMKKYLIFCLAAILIFSAAGFPTTAKKQSLEPEMIIPENAIEVAPGIFSLGRAIDDGNIVEGYAIITYKTGFGKPPWAGGGNGKGNGDEESKYYEFIARGAKWKTIEPYMVNPENTEGLDHSFIETNMEYNIGKWETAAGMNILGIGSTTNNTLVADTSSPDGLNEVYFGDVGKSGAIAVTIIWGIFSGPPSQRELVEWDQIYDQVDYDWSSSGESGKMDFENIATHELGHSVGLDDLYDDKYSEQTMYGYADYGETKKRSLEAGDINGVYQLYR
jgi:hypothetical protein